MCDKNNYIHFLQLHSIPPIDESTSSKDGIIILIAVIIVDPMCVDLLLSSCTTQKFVAFDVVQAKEKNYYDQHPINQFLPLAIEIFGCLHKHVICSYMIVPMLFGA